MKILLAIDGSPHSNEAVLEVAKRPWPLGSTIKIVCAVESGSGVGPWLMSKDSAQELDRAKSEKANTVLDQAADLLRKGCYDKRIITQIIEGSPSQAILDEAKSWEADLIVVGSHCYSALDRFLLGSVSSALASQASCSVEIVRRPKKK
jgi:nucleotide-binding universal stress UspA family protein